MELRQTGRISELQREVLDAMHRSPLVRMTAREIQASGGPPGSWKRLSELKRKGLVSEDGVKTCEVTGKKAIAWVVGGVEPVKKEKRWSFNVETGVIFRDGGMAISILDRGFDVAKVGKVVTQMLNRRFQ